MTLIFVLRHNVERNCKTGERLPVLVVRRDREATEGTEAEILGPSRLVYQPDNPIYGGVTLWIETEAEVKLHG